MPEIIQSSSNRTIKYAKSLKIKKYRDENGAFLIEGEKLLAEALDYNAPVSMILTSRSFIGEKEYDRVRAAAAERGIPLYHAEDRVFREAAETDSPQGIIAVVRKSEYSISSILEKDELCIVVLHEVRDPGNAGTIIRTADACGIDGVVISKGSVDLYNGKTIRSTMGSLFHIPVIQNVDTEDLLRKLKEKSVVTVGADPNGSTSCVEFPRQKKSAIVIGNESKGLSSEIKGLMDKTVRIPMPGRAESLNAGIAAAIMMYEFAVRKKIEG